MNSVSELPAVKAYLDAVGATSHSLLSAVIEERDGKYKRRVATIRFTREGASTIDSREPGAVRQPTEDEASAIRAAILGGADRLPRHEPFLCTVKGQPRPEGAPWAKEDPANVYVFWDASRTHILMVQVRKDRNDGGKDYIPWTYWSDGQWRSVHPEGLLPLWGLEQLKDSEIVFLHEGAKPARAIREQLDNPLKAKCPWLPAMQHGAHLGWIGGAPNPDLTDWSPLRRAKRVYIVADNDAPGMNAVAAVAKRLTCPTYHVQFSREWPEGFDLADDFPKAMFAPSSDGVVYRGPSFASCLLPATWATNRRVIPAEGRGRPRVEYTIRPDFAAQWRWVEDQEVFAALEVPRVLKPRQFNAAVRAFSHVDDTATLLQKHYTGQSAKLTYRPDRKERLVYEDGRPAVNMYRPTLLKPVQGGVEPFFEFLAYLFPIEEERGFVERWIATVVGRPDRRVIIGLLVLSETQGVGKTTLGDILATLVGRHNTSFPGEHSILGAFNSFVANKRLVVVNEIYSSDSWKAYNKLKSYLTDETLEVNEKGLKQVDIPNWTHYFVCSNALNALKIDEKDRRWFVPEVTETPWGRDKFKELRGWLEAGGYGRILNWAQGYREYIEPGENAPRNARKEAVIEDSKSAGWRLARDYGDALMDLGRADFPQKVAVPVHDIRRQVAHELGVRITDRAVPKEREIIKALQKAGMTVLSGNERVKIAKRKLTVACNFVPEEERTEPLPLVIGSALGPLVGAPALEPDEREPF